MPNYIFVRKSVSEAVCKGYLEPLKERLDKESFFSCSVLPSSHFKTFSLVQCSLQATSKPLCTQPLIGRAALEYIILVQVNAASL